jgi:hypothetical protein
MKQLEIDRFWQTRDLSGRTSAFADDLEEFSLEREGRPSRDSRLLQDGRLHVVTSTNDRAALRDPRRV